MDKWLVKVRFINGGTSNSITLSAKEYHYIMDRDKLLPVLLEYKNKECIQIDGVKRLQLDAYHIVNEKGYDYRNSGVVITGVAPVYDTSGYSEIVHIKKGKPVKIPMSKGWYFDFDSVDVFLNMMTDALKVKIDENVAPLGYYEIPKNPYHYMDSVYYSNTVTKKDLYDEVDARVAAAIAMKEEKNEIAVNKERENDNMFKNAMKGLEFGPARDVKFSIYGPAFRSGEGWVAVTAKGDTYDVTGMTFNELDELNYMCPIAAGAIAEGDFVRHNREWVQVLSINDDGTITAHKFSCNEEIVIRPVKNVFGFDFYTKLICLGAQITGTPDATNPFGNMLPLMLMSNGDNGGKSNLLPMMLMMQSMTTATTAKEGEAKANPMGLDFSNPLMLYALLNK